MPDFSNRDFSSGTKKSDIGSRKADPTSVSPAQPESTVQKSDVSPALPDATVQKPTASAKAAWAATTQTKQTSKQPAEPSKTKAASPTPGQQPASQKQSRLHSQRKSAQIDNPDEFEIKFDFDGEYIDVPEDKPVRLRRERRTGLVGGLMLAVFIICVSVVAASVAWMAAMDVLGFGSPDQQVEVVVPEDFDLDTITSILFDAGLIRYSALFRLYASYSNAIDIISPGAYVLNKNFDYRALVQGMTARAGVRVETTVTIPEGFTIAQIFQLLEREGVAGADELWDVATNHDFDFHFLDSETLGNPLRLEGFLFPDTYNFFLDSNPVTVVRRFLREFDRRFTDMYVERAEFMGYTVHEIVIIASMIEREAGDDEERPRIAAVIYNRLNNPNFPFLQIDATIQYAIAGTGQRFSTDIDSPFNSYTNPGLPPGAIANPGIASIRAALYPRSTNEYFYALNMYGTHNFFTNYEDHRNFVNSPYFGG